MKLNFFLYSLFTLSIILIIAGSFFYMSFQSIRLDEAQTIWMTTKPIPTLLRFTSQDVHLPLYFILIYFWVKVFGTDIILVRIPSVVFYFATLIILYFLCRESTSKKASILTVVLFALSPFVLWYSLEARMYTMFSFFTSLNHLFFLRFFRSFAKNSKIPLLISMLLGIYTHYFFLFVISSQSFYIFAKLLTSKDKKQYIKPILIYLGIVLLSIAVLIPWLIFVFNSGFASNTQPLIPTPTSFNIFQTFAFFLFGFHSPILEGLIVALWPLSVALLFFILTKRKDIDVQNAGYFIVVTFLPVILIFLISFIKPIFLARYLIFIVPTFFFLISIFLSSLPKYTSFLSTGFVISILIIFLIYQNISRTTPVKEDYHGVTTYLNSKVRATDIVVISAPFTVYPIEYSYKGIAKIETVPKWERFGTGALPPFSLQNLQDQIKEYRKKYTRMFIILSYDQGYENDVKRYLDNNLERLEKIEYSPNLELRTYKLRYDV